MPRDLSLSSMSRYVSPNSCPKLTKETWDDYDKMQENVAMKNIVVVTIPAVWTLAALLTFTVRPAHAQSKNGLCLTEPEFTDVNAMGQTDEQRLQAIRDWLDGLPGFLKGTITNPDGSKTPYTFTDLDKNPTDPAQEISNAAGANKINPRVLLTTLRKEKPKVMIDPTRPTDTTLRTLTGCGSSPTAQEQIQCMGQKLKEWFYDELSQCKATIGGWDVDVTKQTGNTAGEEKDAAGNACSVTPGSKAATALYQYTPWIGRSYGCGYSLDPAYKDGVGGNGLFCQLWRQHGWEAPPGALAISQPALACAPTSRCVNINASGGTGPHTWTTSKGNLSIPTGVNRQNVKLVPPANPGSNNPGTAYIQHGASVFHQNASCGGPTCLIAGYVLYGCNDQFNGKNTLGCSQTVSCAAPPHTLVCNATATYPQCHQAGGLPTCTAGGVFNTAQPVDYLSNHREAGAICDSRASEAVNCNPCGLAMQGTIITVTDGGGNPATTNLIVK